MEKSEGYYMFHESIELLCLDRFDIVIIQNLRINYSRFNKLSPSVYNNPKLILLLLSSLKCSQVFIIIIMFLIKGKLLIPELKDSLEIYFSY